jgi:hypothetical protein
MMATISVNGCLCEPFEVSSGLRQGCVLAPLLFNLFWNQVVQEWKKRLGDAVGIRVAYKFSTRLQNPRIKSNDGVALVSEGLFADDMELITSTADDMVIAVATLDAVCLEWGLLISTQKTKVMTDGIDDIQVEIRGQKLESVSNFVYLGSKLSRGNDLGPEVARRIGLAAAAFGLLRKPLWKKSEIDKETKFQVYKAVVLPTLLYGAETWTTKQKDIKKLNTFHLRCLRSIIGVSWKDRWTNAKVLETCQSHGMPFLVSCARLRWLGHIARLDSDRLPKQLLFGRLSSTRPAGGPLLRWTDCAKKDLKQASIPIEQWLELAQDPVHWKSLVKDGLGKWETDSMKKPSLLITGEGASGLFPCLNDGCGRQFLSHRGLAQHIRQKHRPVSALVPSASAAMVDPMVLRCTFVGCDRQFSSQRGLAQHIRQNIIFQVILLDLQMLEGTLLDPFFALEMVVIASFLLIVDLRNTLVKYIMC